MDTKKMLRPESQSHRGIRSKLRLIGPCVLGVGVLLVIIGVFSMVNRAPDGRIVFCMFIGMPLIFFGGVMTMTAFAGSVARYHMNEMAPVTRDSFNYMADGTKESIKGVASAVAGGLREGFTGQADTQSTVSCSACGDPNDPDAKFCDNCGQPLSTHAPCTACNTSNDPDAKFCDNCGRSMQRS